MGFFSDIKILTHLIFKPIRGKNHQDRLESFYAGQASGYDDFRKRLLLGRKELWDLLKEPSKDCIWVDFGGGTGANLENFSSERIAKIKKIYLVDLSPSLLKMAQKRIDDRGWKNVELVEDDATTWTPPEGKVDVVTFSYSLTMIPDWFGAIENAKKILKEGGLLGIVDFYVARKYPLENHQKQRWFTRNFWPVWFSSDNVFPSPDHVPFLHQKFHPVEFQEHRAKVPYLFFLKTPYYQFVGQKKETP
ncbi:MAG: class I SAM-dependent methyltransferase [Pirellulaceae bacterium]|nr:class I SAM-dependent methyltransferase [Pirellulaceae bacterium]